MPFNAHTAFEQRRKMDRSQQQPQPTEHSQTRRQSLPKEAVPAPPIAELSENRSWVRLTVDLPGVLATDLDVVIHNGILTISGSRRTLSVDGDVVLKKHKFSRRYAVDTDVVDVSQVNANLSLGVLTVKAPKRARRPEHVKVDAMVGHKFLVPEDPSVKVVVSRSDTCGASKPTPVALIGGESNAAASADKLEAVVHPTVSTYGPGQDYYDHSTSPQMVKPDDESVSSA